MNIVNKVTLRQLKKNKRRTLVTIFGVIISVAMLTAVTTIGVSFMDLMKRQVMATDGKWHVLYKDVTQEQTQAIQEDENTESMILSKDLGYSHLKGSQDKYRPYVFVKAYNEQGFQHFPVNLSSGRFPHAENEVVLSQDIVARAKVHYEIGDTIQLNIGKRISSIDGIHRELDQNATLQWNEEGEIVEEISDTITQEYKIVGFIERPSWEVPWSPAFTIITYLDQNNLGPEDTVNASVALKKVKRSIFKDTEAFAEQHNIENYSFNNTLLRYYGVIGNDKMRSTLYSLIAIIMSIIVIGSVALIYNAFAISVSERSRHLGMLASVGATRQQKRNSVFFEGAVIGLISIPLGILFGLLGMGITFYFINTFIHGALGVTEKLRVTVTFGSILAAVIVSIITIFISTYIPAKRASRISAMDAIRQTIDIKLTNKAVKTSKLVRKIFGIEAEIGLKNLKRNKRRYQATVFSLVISIVLFLSVSYFTSDLKKSLELSQDDINYDIMVELGQEGDEQLVKSILAMDEVTDHSIMFRTSLLNSKVDEEKVGKLIKEDESFSYVVEDGKYSYYVELHVLDDDSFKKYAHRAGVNGEEIQAGKKAIVVDTIQYEDPIAGKYVETTIIKASIGDSLSLYKYDYDKDEELFVDEVEIAALTDELPLGAYSMGLSTLLVIVSESTFQQLGDGILTHEQSTPMLYLSSEDPMKTQQMIEDIEQVRHYIFNLYQIRERDQQMVMLLSVFTYGFITLITLISIANILNTISTSIALRKREFAMLKSIGMTPKGFNKMINYESIFYGIKALLYGIPISIGVMFLMFKALSNSFSYTFNLPWFDMIFAVIAVFVIVMVTMLYASAKVKKENIIDAIKMENL